MNQPVMQPFSHPAENVPDGYPQQLPLNHMRTVSAPAIHQSQHTSSDDLASSIESSSITNNLPSTHLSRDMHPPPTTLSQPISAAYTSSFGGSTTSMISGYPM